MSDVIVPVTASELERLVVLSPHFDDACMGAGRLLLANPGATVVTVMAGPPSAYPDPPSAWDALGGFVSGDDVVALRRLEDAAAMELLGASTVWLEFIDHQYGEVATPDEVAPVLLETLDRLDPTAVVVPFGLANPDHDCVHRAAMTVQAERPDWTWLAYEDAWYSNLPGLLSWRISALFRRGLWPTPALVPLSDDTAQARQALECYRSQLGPLRADHDLEARLALGLKEAHWRLAPPPKGWEALQSVEG